MYAISVGSRPASPSLHAGPFRVGRAPETAATAPIGLYDSGVGGLTVLAAIARRLPHERFVYIADQAHVPYGGRPLSQIRDFACGLARYLFDRGCKAAVMACNVSSATALDDVEGAVGPTHALGVIRPGAEAARAATRNGRIGILATAGTVASEAYPQALAQLDPALAVTQSACPRFVPLVEAQTTAAPEAFEAARAYLAPLLEAGADTVVLGCTHYPFLLDTLRAVAPTITFVDPAEETAAALEATLVEHARVHPAAPAPAAAASQAHLLYTTGDADAFAEQLTRFAPDLAADVRRLPWSVDGADASS